MVKVVPALLILFVMISCQQETLVDTGEQMMVVPDGFPVPEFPSGNELTESRWELGKKLFYEPALSADSTLSCASCHQPSLAFTDGRKKSLGIEGREAARNSPTLANVAYHPYYTREGGVPTLEMQILVPVQEHAEFDFNILLIAERLNRMPEYVAASMEAYGILPDPFVITRAIGCFERTLLSGESRYDLYTQGKATALSPAEKLGMVLFFSERLACSKCHGGFNFTDYSFQNNGLYEQYEDPGRFRLTGDPDDLSLFKVPAMRNIGVTAPYMHDGSMESLGEVINHYDSGGKNHIHKSKLIRPLGLTEMEKKSLEAFLMALTDQKFISNPKFLQE